MLIRNEEEKDYPAVRALNVSAFESPAEANLVDALRRQVRPVISLVAEDNKEIVGHIMFSPVSLSAHPSLKIMGLAPMAVAPAHRNKGIGSSLVRAGLERCKDLGFGAVVVLARFGIDCEFEAPEEAFMVVELQPNYLHGKSGTIKYYATFENV